LAKSGSPNDPILRAILNFQLVIWPSFTKICHGEFQSMVYTGLASHVYILFHKHSTMLLFTFDL